jgi:hypothetical protein
MVALTDLALYSDFFQFAQHKVGRVVDTRLSCLLTGFKPTPDKCFAGVIDEFAKAIKPPEADHL